MNLDAPKAYHQNIERENYSWKQSIFPFTIIINQSIEKHSTIIAIETTRFLEVNLTKAAQDLYRRKIKYILAGYLFIINY